MKAPTMIFLFANFALQSIILVKMFENLYRLLRRYVEVRLQILENHLQDNLYELFSKTIIILICFFLASASLLFFCFAVALALNTLLDSNFIGFAIVSSLFLVVLGVTLLPQIRKKLYSKLLEYFYMQKDK